MRLNRAYRIAGDEISRVENAFILLRDKNGLLGVGAATPMPEICGENIDETVNALKVAGEILNNVKITSPVDIWAKLYPFLHKTPAALAAADMAVYDLYCKSLEVPVVEFLGRKWWEMETSVTIGITTEEMAREELKAHLRNRFSVIKVKIGDNLEHDIMLVKKLREWGGRQFRLRVDANQGYDLPSLIRFIDETEKLDVELIEQPLPAPAQLNMLKLPEQERRRCMADEDLVDESDAALLSGNGAYGMWNIKLMKSGGITPAKRIALLADEARIDVMWGCNDESRIAIAAAMHTAFSASATKYLDLDGAFDIGHDIANGGFVVDNGKMRLLDAPGLGVRLID